MSEETTRDLVQVSAEESDPSTSALTNIVTYSVLGGLCPLIPIPFVDDIIIKVINKRMIASVCKSHGLTLSKEDIKALSKEPSGCPLGCFFTIFTYPIRNILKKVLFFLSIKSCVDVTSTMLHRGYLLDHCLASGTTDGSMLQDQAALVRVQESIVATCKAVDSRPINQAIKKIYAASKVLLRGTARSLWAMFRSERKGHSNRKESLNKALDRAKAEETSGLKSVLQQVRAEVWSQEGYLTALTQSFDADYAERNRQLRGAEPQD